MNKVEGVRIDRKLFGVPLRKPVDLIDGQSVDIDSGPLSDLVTTKVSFENRKGPSIKDEDSRILMGETTPTLTIRRTYVSRAPIEQSYDLTGRNRVKHRAFPGYATIYTRIPRR